MPLNLPAFAPFNPERRGMTSRGPSPGQARRHAWMRSKRDRQVWPSAAPAARGRTHPPRHDRDPGARRHARAHLRKALRHHPGSAHEPGPEARDRSTSPCTTSKREKPVFEALEAQPQDAAHRDRAPREPEVRARHPLPHRRPAGGGLQDRRPAALAARSSATSKHDQPTKATTTKPTDAGRLTP